MGASIDVKLPSIWKASCKCWRSIVAAVDGRKSSLSIWPPPILSATSSPSYRTHYPVIRRPGWGSVQSPPFCVRPGKFFVRDLFVSSLFLLTLSSLPHISIVKRTLVNQMWHFQCSLLLVTKDGNNATRNTKTGKQKVWERGLSECQSEVPKTAESNKETFDLPPLSLPSRPNSWPQVFGDSDPTRPNVYEASSDQSGVTTPHHHQYSRLCSPFILKYISPNTCCAGHSINNRLTFTKHFSCTLYIGKELSICFPGQSFSKSYQEHLRMFKYVRLGPGAVYIHTIIHPGQEVVTGWKLWKLSWVRAQ